MSPNRWWTDAPPVTRKAIRTLILFGLGLILVDVLWGALSAPLLQAFATQMGGYGDPLVTVAELLTHVVVEVGTPLGSAFVAAGIAVALLARVIVTENEKRLL